MERRRLGSTGATVGVVGLGTSTWGLGTGPQEAGEHVAMLLDAGGNVVDVDPSTTDPAILRDAIVGAGVRPEIFLSLRLPAAESRGSLLSHLDAALGSLGIDHADLWMIEGWTDGLPWEEIVSALAVAQQTGRAMYVGLAPREPWQASLVAGALASHADRSDLAALCFPFSLLDVTGAGPYRDIADLLRLGIIASWSLAGGVLTGKYRHATPPDSRGAGERYADRLHRYREPWARPVVEGLSAAAEGLGVPTGSLALAWLREQPHVATSLVGARTAHQWRAALDSAHVAVPSEIRHVLDEVATQASHVGENAYEDT